MGGDDLPGRGANRIARQLLYQVLAQAGVPQAVAIAKQGADAGAHDLPGEFVQPHVHQPVHWREAFAKRRVAGLADKLLAHQPYRVHSPGVGQRVIGFVSGRGARAHEETEPVTGLDQALGRQ